MDIVSILRLKSSVFTIDAAELEMWFMVLTTNILIAKLIMTTLIVENTPILNGTICSNILSPTDEYIT